jgi:hypothetical protein
MTTEWLNTSHRTAFRQDEHQVNAHLTPAADPTLNVFFAFGGRLS